MATFHLEARRLIISESKLYLQPPLNRTYHTQKISIFKHLNTCFFGHIYRAFSIICISTNKCTKPIYFINYLIIQLYTWYARHLTQTQQQHQHDRIYRHIKNCFINRRFKNYIYYIHVLCLFCILSIYVFYLSKNLSQQTTYK
jgi:hypothetical protein